MQMNCKQHETAFRSESYRFGSESDLAQLRNDA